MKLNFKEFIKYIFSKLNLHIIKIGSKIHYIEEGTTETKVSEQTLSEIFRFFSKIDPFYNDQIRKELLIAGAWKDDLKTRRKNQLKAIIKQDKNLYRELLDNLFRSELISGLWDVSYFNKDTLGSIFSIEHTLILKKIIDSIYGKYEESFIVDGDFGKPWGVAIRKNKIVNYSDIVNYFYATNCTQILRSQSKDCPVFIDLGSGYGNLALKTAKMLETKSKFILIDIPLNLTTAYAYVKTNSDYDCNLICSLDELDRVKNTTLDSTTFYFIPSNFVEQIPNLINEIDLLYNHGSFSEMDKITIDFYLDILTNKINCNYVYEINSNEPVLNTGGHIEIPSSEFGFPSHMKLISKSPNIKSSRYVASLYRNTSKSQTH
mgnify:CR=1 FL=1